MKKKLYILVSVLIIVLVGGYFVNQKLKRNEPLPKIILSSSPTIIPTPSPTPTATPTPTPAPSEIPSSFLIENFPFQPQAPFANWDQTHDEACEEAAVILVKYWAKGKSSISAQTMDDEILAMVDWEIKNWGSHKDLTVKETASLAEGFYSLALAPKYGITIDDIKEEVAQNRPVIVPTAGRLLGNPYFRSPGPIYHMLVVIGYKGNTIIVQDIGTRRGEHYQYSSSVLLNAIHDWAGSPDNIESGQKAMLVFED